MSPRADLLSTDRHRRSFGRAVAQYNAWHSRRRRVSVAREKKDRGVLGPMWSICFVRVSMSPPPPHLPKLMCPSNEPLPSPRCVAKSNS